MGARAVGPWVGQQKPLGKTPHRGNPSPESTYLPTFNPLCERQNHVVEQNLRILMKQERIKDWVRLVPWAVLTMNSQRSSSTGFTPHHLFQGGRPAWFFKIPFAEDFKSPVGDWLEHKHSMANEAGTNLRHIRDRELSRRNRLGRPASFARRQTRHTRPPALGPKRPGPRQGATTPHHETHGSTPATLAGEKCFIVEGLTDDVITLAANTLAATTDAWDVAVGHPTARKDRVQDTEDTLTPDLVNHLVTLTSPRGSTTGKPEVRRSLTGRPLLTGPRIPPQ